MRLEYPFYQSESEKSRDILEVTFARIRVRRLSGLQLRTKLLVQGDS
jgi:hypothetical protein